MSTHISADMAPVFTNRLREVTLDLSQFKLTDWLGLDHVLIVKIIV